VPHDPSHHDLPNTPGIRVILPQRNIGHEYFCTMLVMVGKWRKTAISAFTTANLILLLSPPVLRYLRSQNSQLPQKSRGRRINARPDL
jgi:hypothetical protein